MNVVKHPMHKESEAFGRSEAFLHASSGLLRGYIERLEPLHEALRLLIDIGEAQTKRTAARYALQLERIEPSVTMIGQIKSGKTTLVNALIGQPDLLPADVNPWTSVVTSLHLSPKEPSPATSAVFRFFDLDEWDKLVSGGGRIGELADRAGADEELSKIRAQVEMMRTKSKARLGRKFEALLGTQHSYGYFDHELIERYVCLGDDFDGEDAKTSRTRGRFADITKSADLRMQQRGYPINLCVRDTPGVNDTFMIREQITIKAIRDSRLCVVVLSAHQALSSTDLALIRLISNVKSREVVIFVNRIDELSSPQIQVRQIEESILKTLRAHNGPIDAKIIFGSALWAQSAIQGSLLAMPDASRDALLDWAEVARIVDAPTDDPHQLLWELSGLPALIQALSERMIAGEMNETVRQTTISTRNLINGVKVADNLSARTNIDSTSLHMPHEQILEDLETLRKRHSKQLSSALDDLIISLRQRVEQSHNSFLSRATDALAKHLEIYGEKSVWTYDPSGLRVLLASAYKVFGGRCQAAFKRSAAEAVEDLADVFHRALNLPHEFFSPSTPIPPRIAPPVTLGQTIALDLHGSWWKSWWTRRQSYEAQARNFYDLIRAETGSLVTDLVDDQAAALKMDVFELFEDFLDEQTANLAGLTKSRAVSADDVSRFIGIEALQERDRALSEAFQTLERYVA
ncbi:dynamin family protein [Flavimaricola marinus]|uniref:GTP-binding protein Der n=1 Tax=Flavimaricola marinus TaxID=1819565 RepID=A0A238LEE4_9RHOB|nr:dynamin family protein [Flavimaricola marinus]SMY07290.1 GTP-binding protein Der [Flavimaricola marinus]